MESNCGLAPLAAGRVALAADRKLVKILLIRPAVRVLTDAEFVYRVKRADNGKLLAKDAPNPSCPTDLSLRSRHVSAAIAPAYQTSPMACGIAERGQGFPSRVSRMNQVSDCKIFDILVVGMDQLDRSPFCASQTAGPGRKRHVGVRSPADRVESLAGYTSASTSSTDKLVWRDRQPVLRRLTHTAVNRWGRSSLAIRLPADGPALELVSGREKIRGFNLFRSTHCWLQRRSAVAGSCCVRFRSGLEGGSARAGFVGRLSRLFRRCTEPTLPPSRRPRTLQVQIRPPQQNQILDPVEPR